MIYKYLLHVVENGKKRYFPCHPLSERVFLVDGEYIPAMTEDETEFDKVPEVIDPSVSDKIKAGAALKPMGTPPVHDGLTAARFAQSFVSAFEAAGKRGEPAPEPTPEPASEPASEPAPEPAK